MKTFKILAFIIAALITLFHIGSVAFKKKIAGILTYVNLGLHIAEFFVLMALEVSFEFCALFFMISLFIYLFSAFVSCKIKGKDEQNDV